MVSEPFIQSLGHDRANFGLSRTLQRDARQFIQILLGILYPHFSACSGESIEEEAEEVDGLLRAHVASASADTFWSRLPQVKEWLDADARAIDEADPASTGVDEVILAYHGFLAIAAHRIAHEFYLLDERLFARLVSEYSHEKTGIEIHPGARIGRGFAIDHGTGIVIGETAEIGDHVRLYQGVTLGALAVRKDLAGAKRHPTIEDDVVIYANATILGGQTVVGRGSTIGGNVWLTESVPPRSRVTRTTIVRSTSDDLEFNI